MLSNIEKYLKEGYILKIFYDEEDNLKGIFKKDDDIILIKELDSVRRFLALSKYLKNNNILLLYEDKNIFIGKIFMNEDIFSYEEKHYELYLLLKVLNEKIALNELKNKYKRRNKVLS